MEDRAPRAEDVPVDDATLLSEVAAGDRGRPLEELFRRYAGRLYGLGLRQLCDPGMAEELVQETFVRLWRQASRFDPTRGTVSSFVFTIARNIAIDLRRRPSSRQFVDDPKAERTGVPADHAALVVDGIVVREALASLSPSHREVLELSYAGGLTQLEIADRVGLPLGTVKSRTYHALRALRAALEAQGVNG